MTEIPRLGPPSHPTLIWKVSQAHQHLPDRSRVSRDRFAVTHRIMLRRFGLGVTDMSVRPRFQISSSRLLDRGESSPRPRGDRLAQNGAWKIRWNASGSDDSSTTSPSTGRVTQTAPEFIQERTAELTGCAPANSNTCGQCIRPTTGTPRTRRMTARLRQKPKDYCAAFSAFA
jgi:hypothetical protein